MNASTSQEAGAKSTNKRDTTSMTRLKNIGSVLDWENIVTK